MRAPIITTLASLIFASTCHAMTTVKAFVADEQQSPLSQVQVTVNGKTINVTKDGSFDITQTDAASYQVSLSKKGYYTRIQTFSDKELTQLAQDPATFTLVAKKKHRVMLAFGGDVMMGRRYYKPYFDDEPLIHPGSDLEDSKAILANVKPYLSVADIAAVNLESQLSEHEPSERAKKSVTFYTKPSIVRALQWAGIDYVTLGNNHTYDYLDEGLDSTLKALDEAKLPYSGAGFDEASALAPYNMRKNQSAFAMLGYVGWQGSSNPKQTATPQHGGAAFGSLENIVSGVEKAVNNKHIPIVQYHGSLEYKNEPTGVTEQRLKSALDKGAALAVAHHPHVTQGLELYDNKLIAYSMGNFVFDQNFSSTQHSYLLYVWLDEGRFHRAEIVPIYVKGYKPTPAIDDERFAVLKRIHTLSAKRDTYIENHLGHGVITKDNSPSATSQGNSFHFNNNQRQVHSLAHLPWNKGQLNIQTNDPSLKYRLGTNLINGSDFDNFALFDATERGFSYNKAVAEIVSGGFQSKQALALPQDQALTLGMKHFRRVYRPSTPMTFKTDIKLPSNATVNLYWQGRKTRQKLFDAFNNSPKQLISSVKLDGSQKWQHLEIPFNSPRIGYKSYRVLIEVIPDEPNSQHMLIDNFSLIEWQTAYQNKPVAKFVNVDSKMSTYIGFNKPTKDAVTVSTQ